MQRHPDFPSSVHRADHATAGEHWTVIRHLAAARPGYTPENLRAEMIGYANNALVKRLHAIGIEVAV